MSDFKHIQNLLAEHSITYIDIRFTDSKGKWQHVTLHADCFDESVAKDGFMFDGSSIAGWKNIDKSDMIIKLDLSTAFVDPFTAQPTLVITGDIFEPSTGEAYERDPRSTAKRAEAYLKESGLGDSVFFGPELEFFVFDDVRFAVGSHNTFYSLDSEESPTNTGTKYEGGNMGHRPGVKGGYFPVAPIDSCQDLRSEMLTVLGEMAVTVEKHHHEVAASQHELGIKYNTLTRVADDIQKFKYAVHNVAHAYGKTATFMPKPVLGDNGSGMHVHQSIWKAGKNTFAGNGYADLSETALHYIGGIIKHAKALNAFTNPSTNSYKRLVPGYEAPVLLAYSARNRSASCRIPYAVGANAKRVEVRFPDGTANPYLAFAAMLMAGLDGIKNKINPGEAMDKNLYDLPEKELKKIPHVCGSLREALAALDKDRAFLKEGGVFSDDLIDAYITLKMEDVIAFEHTPHPVEFKMYYSV